MELENFITDGKEYDSVEQHGHNERRGHVALDFHIDAVLCVCDLIIIVQRPRKHYRGGANPGDPKNCKSMTNESFLEINGVDTFEEEIRGRSGCKNPEYAEDQFHDTAILDGTS